MPFSISLCLFIKSTLKDDEVAGSTESTYKLQDNSTHSLTTHTLVYIYVIMKTMCPPGYYILTQKIKNKRRFNNLIFEFTNDFRVLTIAYS